MGQRRVHVANVIFSCETCERKQTVRKVPQERAPARCPTAQSERSSGRAASVRRYRLRQPQIARQSARNHPIRDLVSLQTGVISSHQQELQRCPRAHLQPFSQGEAESQLRAADLLLLDPNRSRNPPVSGRLIHAKTMSVTMQNHQLKECQRKTLRIQRLSHPRTRRM